MDPIRKQIPDVLKGNSKYPPFQALAYILENCSTLTSKEIARELNEDTAFIELQLYKHRRLMLTDNGALKRLHRLKKKMLLHHTVATSNLLISSNYSMAEFLRMAGLPYSDTIALIRADLLETAQEFAPKGETKKTITGRSAVYHFRQMIRGDKYYAKQAGKALGKRQKWFGPALDIQGNTSSSAQETYVKEISAIPILGRNEEIRLAMNIFDSQKAIESIVCTTDYMLEELHRIHKLAKKGDQKFIRHMRRNLRGNSDNETLRKQFIISFNTLKELFDRKRVVKQENGKEKEMVSIEKEIRKQVLSLDIGYDLASVVLTRLKNLSWDIKLAAENHDIHTGEHLEPFQALTGTSGLSHNELEDSLGSIAEHERLIYDAKEEFIIRNLRLVAAFAKHDPAKYSFGVEALIQAVDAFDFRRGYRFSTYASWGIKQKIAVGQKDAEKTIRLPANIQEKLNLINKTEEYLKKKIKRSPRPDEVLKEYNRGRKKTLSFDEFCWMREISANVATFGGFPEERLGNIDRRDEMPASITYDSEIHENHTLSQEQAVFEREKRKILRNLISVLSSREQKVLCMRFGIDESRRQSLEDIGKEIGLSGETIRQIEEKAIQRLREHSRLGKLRDLLR